VLAEFYWTRCGKAAKETAGGTGTGFVSGLRGISITLPVFWMNLQTRYDLEVAQDEIAAKVARDVRPLETQNAG
jgi:hypothetical protein